MLANTKHFFGPLLFLHPVLYTPCTVNSLDLSALSFVKLFVNTTRIVFSLLLHVLPFFCSEGFTNHIIDNCTVYRIFQIRGLDMCCRLIFFCVEKRCIEGTLNGLQNPEGSGLYLQKKKRTTAVCRPSPSQSGPVITENPSHRARACQPSVSRLDGSDEFAR